MSGWRGACVGLAGVWLAVVGLAFVWLADVRLACVRLAWGWLA